VKRCEEEKVLIQKDIQNTICYFQNYSKTLVNLLHPPIALWRITTIHSEISLVRMFLHELNQSFPTELVNVNDELNGGLVDSNSSSSDMESVSGESCDLDM
jgi:hypothetical protein